MPCNIRFAKLRLYILFQMYSLDGRLSLQSLSEFDSSRSWIAEHALTPTPPPPPEDNNDNLFYIGIALPKRLITIFPEPPQSSISTVADDVPKSDIDTTEVDEESCSEYDVDAEHCRICLICYHGKSSSRDSIAEQEKKLQRYDITR